MWLVQTRGQGEEGQMDVGYQGWVGSKAWEQCSPFAVTPRGHQGDLRATTPPSPHMTNPNSPGMKVCGKFLLAVYEQDWGEVWLQGKVAKTRKMRRIPCCE